ncbi:MAG: NAD-dependent aldehyde dehydrogenase [Actinomycetia bacterium]|nr:NAD-dependent aldehyde dehydrogenase [Actinomycetes bacterium]
MTTTAPSPASSVDASVLVDRLRRTFASGRTRPLEWRREQLTRLRALVNECEPELTAALAADLGKPAIEAFVTELAFVKLEVDTALANLEHWTAPRPVPVPWKQKPGRARIVAEPLGVVLVIAPWNYPVQLTLAPMVAALAAGNCVVAKPSEVSAHTSATLGRLIPQYLDHDAVAVVEGGVPETQALLDERWDHILYTGNGTVGRIVMAAAAKHLTPVTLELGGKSPVIIDRDADVDVAARRVAWGKYLNAGQTCIAPDYALVHADVEERFITAVVRSIREFFGDDPHRSPDYARIVNGRHLRRLEHLLPEPGRSADGTVVVGGERDEHDWYFAPTVLRDVSTDAPVMQEEIFGPILPVIAVPDLQHAVDFVNARDKPLALYVFSADESAVEQVVEHTSSGGVCVNHVVLHFMNENIPFGGVGPSGTGAYHGRTGFETFSHLKGVVSRTVKPDPKVAYPPYSAFKRAVLRRYL